MVHLEKLHDHKPRTENTYSEEDLKKKYLKEEYAFNELIKDTKLIEQQQSDIDSILQSIESLERSLGQISSNLLKDIRTVDKRAIELVQSLKSEFFRVVNEKSSKQDF